MTIESTNESDVKISVYNTECSMGCLYAESPIDLCMCGCMGETHGILSGKLILPAHCSPAAEKRCKAGDEDGPCECACGGKNHGIYQGVEDVKITTFTE